MTPSGFVSAIAAPPDRVPSAIPSPRWAGRSPQRRSKSGLADIARPTEQKKGADKGIDGRIYFHDEAAGGKTKQVILSVKEGIRVQRMFETSAASSIGRRERLESSFPCRCRPLR